MFLNLLIWEYTLFNNFTIGVNRLPDVSLDKFVQVRLGQPLGAVNIHIFQNLPSALPS